MKRGLRNLTFFGLVLIFAIGLLCSGLAAPGQSLASASGCSQNSGAMAMAGCEYPNYLCGLDSSSPNSQAAFSSFRPNDLLKSALFLAVGEVPLAAPSDRPLLDKGRLTPSVIGPHKVPIHLFNSVLTL